MGLFGSCIAILLTLNYAFYGVYNIKIRVINLSWRTKGILGCNYEKKHWVVNIKPNPSDLKHLQTPNWPNFKL
jgi:hypothetical protein